ncbi:tetratricopeptide repeat protein [Ornithinibacillus halophilus]|uniref:Uncharacterized protein n=1 Tax=Ornithinibacillus halophilus TaxID=930117 RepID=A0A1M5LKG1_9BACI|nr:hypothetical protein [Ornithinibacillus halophilus]SHG65518.1 hypothetical protein SAMN05216225_104811 [Ornithinibacillus halophilus]
MRKHQLTVYNRQQPIKLKAERVVFYLQGEIIEAVNRKNEEFYLFFYKNRFLTAAKTTKLRRACFIEKAFKSGIVFDGSHPIVSKLLSSNAPCHIIGFDILLKKLNSHYSPHEKSFILTFFESFISKKKLLQEMISIFYDFRRNGQLFHAYQITQIIKEFAPDHNLVKQLTNDVAYQKYAIMYEEKSEELFTKDLLYAEKLYYYEKENLHYFHNYIQLVENQSRWISAIALWIWQVSNQPTKQNYQSLIERLNEQFDDVENIYILEKVSKQIPKFIPIQQDLFQLYVEINDMDKLFRLMKQKEFQLNDKQVQLIGDRLAKTNWEKNSSPLDMETMDALLKPISKEFPDKAEPILTNFVISLLKTKELNEVKNWLKQSQGSYDNFSIYKKVKQMVQLENELDEMQTLGELYFDLKLYDRAIECFSWEMEMKPQDPKPVQWLSKTYREMGMPEESEAYRKHSNTL